MEVKINKEIFDRLKKKVKDQRFVSMELLFEDEVAASYLVEGLKCEAVAGHWDEYFVKIEQIIEPRQIGDK